MINSKLFSKDKTLAQGHIQIKLDSPFAVNVILNLTIYPLNENYHLYKQQKSGAKQI